MFSSLLQLITVGIFLCLVLAGVVVWLGNCFARHRQTFKAVDRSLAVHRSDHHEQSPSFHAHHSLDRHSIHAIKDHSRRLRKELEQCELAMCNLFEIQRFDGSHRYDEIVSAVYSGDGWPKLMADYNLNRYGARWHSNTRSARSTV